MIFSPSATVLLLSDGLPAFGSSLAWKVGLGKSPLTDSPYAALKWDASRIRFCWDCASAAIMF
jgi:hypothetical protein